MPVSLYWARLALQKNGYFRMKNEKGKYLDIDGNIVPENLPIDEFMRRTHIPYEGLKP